MFVLMGGRRKHLYMLSFLFLPIFSMAQTKDVSFLFPLDTTAYLSGTFGEFRGSHFHAGIDIKTFGKEGLPVRAAQDGYVSRIKISPYGYGKAIYITHNNGYTTVYGHMNGFNESISKYIRKNQYYKRSFSIELFPKKTQFRVRKGDIIGYSGNTGGSSAPHLHFEIRDSRTQEILNPLLFQLGIEDTVAPVLLKAYFQKRNRAFRMHNGFYPELAEVDLLSSDTTTLTLSQGQYALTFAGKDFLNEDTSNILGVYGVDLKINSDLVYHRQFDRFSFSDAKYIGLVSAYKKGLPPLENCFKESWHNLKLSSYESNGWFNLESSTSPKLLSLRLYDEKGNEKQKVIRIFVGPEEKHLSEQFSEEEGKMVFQHPVTFRPEDGISVDFFGSSFFDSTRVSVKVSHEGSTDSLYILPENSYSHERFRIIFTLNEEQKKEASKWCIAHVGEEVDTYVGSYLTGNQVSARTKSFGTFYLKSDKVAPEIGEILIDGTTLSVSISDNFSGIDKYTAYINNRWFLLEFDPKTMLLKGDLSEFTSQSKLEFKLVVEDNADNSTEIKETIELK